MSTYYTFVVHHQGGVEYIDNVDPDMICHRDMVEELLEITKIDHMKTITLKYEVAGAKGFKRLINCDNDMLEMFDMCREQTEICLFVEEVYEDECINDSESVSDDNGIGEQWGTSSRQDRDEGIDGDMLMSGGGDIMQDDLVDDDDKLSDYEPDAHYASLVESSAESGDHDDFEYEFVVERDMESPKFRCGQKFADIHAFRDALREYCVKEGCDIVRLKNEKSRVTAKCIIAGCNWRIHASPMQDGFTFEVKTYKGEHTCNRVHKNRQATATWIAKKIGYRLRDEPKWSISAIKNELQEAYGIDAGNMQIYRAREKAIEEIEGRHGKSFSKLPRYAEIIRRTNPGSFVKMMLDKPDINVNPIFKRFFVSFTAMRKGFIEGCRPLIGIDGCHIKNSYGGVILTAIGLDGNNGIFPIAVAVAEAEMKDSWTWFLEMLHMAIGEDERPLAFMTDRQKGIINALQQVMPNASHRFCARHMYSNFKKLYKGLALKNAFWKAARSYTVEHFNISLEEMKRISNDAYNWVKEIPSISWSRYGFDSRIKNDHLTNNFTESFNNWILECREKPITTLLEMIRRKWMVKIQKRYEGACKWESSVCPKVLKTLETGKHASRYCRVIYAGRGEYEVQDNNGVSFIVNIGLGRCNCRVWELSGIPCHHAIQCLIRQRANIEEFVHPYFSKDTYLRAYQHMIHPIPDEMMWPEVEHETVAAPPLRRLPGRPRKSRRKEPNEDVGSSQSRKAKTVRCNNCKQLGHNSRSCQRAPVHRSQGRGQGQVRVRGRGRG